MNNDNVNHPKHYKIGRFEAKDIISVVLWNIDMNPEEAYYLGCILKYRLRAGKKNDALEDIEKANKYEEFLNEDDR